MWVRKPQYINLLFVMPEGIQIEESLWAGRTGQPNTQMGPAHMSTNGHTRGGWFFTAPLNLAHVDPLDAPPYSDERSVMFVGIATSTGLRDSQGGSLLCLYALSATGAEDSRSTSSGSWEEWVWTWWWWWFIKHLLAGGWAIDMAAWDQVPHKFVQAFCLRTGHCQLHLLEAHRLQALSLLMQKAGLM